MAVNQAQVGGSGTPPPPQNYLSGPKKSAIWIVLVGIAVAAWIFLPMLNSRRAVEQTTGRSDIMSGRQLAVVKDKPVPETHVAPNDNKPAPGQQRNGAEQVAEGYGPVSVEITDKTGTSSSAQVVEGGAGEHGRGSGVDGARGNRDARGTDEDDFGGLMHRSRTGGTTVAHMMKHRKFTVPMGSMIPCILETAVNSQLKGYVKCHVTKDGVTGQDGSVTLIDPGAWIFGEAKYAPKNHQSRIFLLWTHGQNPDGAEFDLSSPATDELGRSGVVGGLETFFWEKFGAALAFSLIEVFPSAVNTALQSLNNRQNNSGGFNFTESSTFFAPQQQLTGTILQDILNMPPEITLNQGTFLHAMLNENVYFPMYDIELTGR